MEKHLISIHDQIARIKIHPDFYPDSVVEQTIFAFRDICTIKQDGIFLEINAQEQLEKICYELYNYMIALLKNDPTLFT